MKKIVLVSGLFTWLFCAGAQMLTPSPKRGATRQVKSGKRQYQSTYKKNEQKERKPGDVKLHILCLGVCVVVIACTLFFFRPRPEQKEWIFGKKLLLFVVGCLAIKYLLQLIFPKQYAYFFEVIWSEEWGWILLALFVIVAFRKCLVARGGGAADG